MTKDGRRLDVALTISPVRDDSGADHRRVEDRPRHHGAEAGGSRADPAVAGNGRASRRR